MNVLICGSGKGSYEVRGRQLGAALGARVTSKPLDDDFRWADVVVLVKRAGMAWAEQVHRFGKPIVWDALDFWRQPEENSLSESESKALLQAHIHAIRPALVIGATEAMAQACGGVYLPHHSRPGLTPSPARDAVTTVGYEGTRKYLGRWGKAVEQECARRGWKFVINPTDLRDCDILVAFRDAEWDGWMCREWKSGVKLVNATAAGRPVICQPSAAAREIDPAGSVIETPDQVCKAFDRWEKYIGWRESAVHQCVDDSDAFTLSAVAERYRQILQAVKTSRVAA